MKKIMLYVMAVFYVLAGVNHFLHPEGYWQIMPRYIPWHVQLVMISGIFEILLGILLLPKLTRAVAAWLIIILLIAVFPANWQMTVNYYHQKNPYLWIAILRLPLQIVLVWWAWLYTKKRGSTS